MWGGIMTLQIKLFYFVCHIRVSLRLIVFIKEKNKNKKNNEIINKNIFFFF